MSQKIKGQRLNNGEFQPFYDADAVHGDGLDAVQDSLIEILRNAVFETDQSENITALENAIQAISPNAGLVRYNVTYALVNTNSSNTAKRAYGTKSYSTNISAKSGYTMVSVSVTMGGVDITSTAYSNGVINIPVVSGDITINAAAEESLTMLKSITLSDGAHIDTGYISASINDRLLLGAKYRQASDIVAGAVFGGVSRYPASGTAIPDWYTYSWSTYTANNENSACFGITKTNGGSMNQVNTRLYTTGYSQDAPASFLDVPFYYYSTDGQQELWGNEEMTERPAHQIRAVLSNTVQYSTTVAELPIDSIWLGRSHDAGSRGLLQASGIVLYVFKVWDESGNLIVNMRPAMQGSAVGMYDVIRGHFYPAVDGNVSYEEVEE